MGRLSRLRRIRSSQGCLSRRESGEEAAEGDKLEAFVGPAQAGGGAPECAGIPMGWDQ